MTNLHFMDNKEAPRCITDYLQANDITRQLVSPNINHRNASECVISTRKDPFITDLYTPDPIVPMHLWDYILPPCDYTLNMLCASRINPTLSIYH